MLSSHDGSEYFRTHRHQGHQNPLPPSNLSSPKTHPQDTHLELADHSHSVVERWGDGNFLGSTMACYCCSLHRIHMDRRSDVAMEAVCYRMRAYSWSSAGRENGRIASTLGSGWKRRVRASSFAWGQGNAPEREHSTKS
jgi:hypothetical protein